MALLVVAVAYWATTAAALALTRNTDGIASMWPASGILVAGLLALRPRLSLPCIALCAIGSFCANAGEGLPLPLTLGYTIANMGEGWLAATLMRRWGAVRPSFIDPRDVARFCGASVVAGLWSMTVATLATGLFGGGADWRFSLSWFSTVTLGMLIVAPTMLTTLALFDPRQRDGIRPRSATEALAFLAMVGAVSLLVFMQSRYPLLYLPMVALLAATYRLGPFGAAAGVMTIAVIGSVMTGLGHGPLGLLRMDSAETAFFLESYQLVLFATALPLAALLSARARLSARCSDSERLHRLLADSSSDIIVRFTVAGVPLYASPATARVLGFTPAQMLARRPLADVHADDRPAILAAWTRIATGEPGDVCIYRQRRADGSYAWLEAAYRLLPGVDGASDEVVATIRDVSRRREAELRAEEAVQRMRDANHLLSMAEHAAGVGHWRLGMLDGTLFWSPEVFRLHGLAPADASPGLEAAIRFYHPDDVERVDGVVRHAMAVAGAFEYAARIVRPDGVVRHVVTRGQTETDADGRAVALFGIIQDVTRQVIAEQALLAARRAAEESAERALQLVDTDGLTGVASRRRALAVLDDAVALADRQGSALAVAIFDIDHFKQVNDNWGHAAGDLVLRQVAQAATESVRSTDMVGRLGGEEFVVLLPGAGEAAAIALVDRLRRAIAERRTEGAEGLSVTASIGIALFRPGATPASLLGDADRALYRAKAEGRNAARLAA